MRVVFSIVLLLIAGAGCAGNADTDPRPPAGIPLHADPYFDTVITEQGSIAYDLPGIYNSPYVELEITANTTAIVVTHDVVATGADRGYPVLRDPDGTNYYGWEFCGLAVQAMAQQASSCVMDLTNQTHQLIPGVWDLSVTSTFGVEQGVLAWAVFEQHYIDPRA